MSDYQEAVVIVVRGGVVVEIRGTTPLEAYVADMDEHRVAPTVDEVCAGLGAIFFSETQQWPASTDKEEQ
jgi:hypothetical protein